MLLFKVSRSGAVFLAQAAFVGISCRPAVVAEVLLAASAVFIRVPVVAGLSNGREEHNLMLKKVGWFRATVLRGSSSTPKPKLWPLKGDILNPHLKHFSILGLDSRPSLYMCFIAFLVPMM